MRDQRPRPAPKGWVNRYSPNLGVWDRIRCEAVRPDDADHWIAESEMYPETKKSPGRAETRPGDCRPERS